MNFNNFKHNNSIYEISCSLNKIEPKWFNELILKCSPTKLENFYVYDKILRQKSNLSNNQKQLNQYLALNGERV